MHVAYRQACLNAIEYLKKFGYTGAQAYAILGTAPVQGHISGVVDIPNACATLWLPTEIFDFDIMPGAGGPVQSVSRRRDDAAGARSLSGATAMPEYDYLCDACGAVSEIASDGGLRRAAALPGLRRAAPRALLTVPAFATMDAGRRTAHATNERSAHAPALSSRTGRHPAGCGCCTSGRTGLAGAPGAVKGFPSKRPWMISH